MMHSSCTVDVMAALPEPFTVHISARREYKAGDDIECKVTITNNDSRDYKLLIHNTPLEGLRSHIFIISKYGRDRVIPIPYDGVMVKRGPPSENNCVLIKAKSSLLGSSLESLVDLSHAHGIDSPHIHIVQLKMTLHFHENKPNCFLDRTQKVVSNGIEFTVIQSLKQHKMTKGAIVRKQQPPAPAARGPTVTKLAGTGPKAPKLVGNYPNDSQKRDTVEAYKLAYRAISKSISGTTRHGNPALYKEWFGRPYKDAPNRNYLTMGTAIENKEFTLKVNTDSKMSDIFAYTYKGDTTIYLCDLYFAAKLTGADCKMGVIVHEMSHAAAYLDDVLDHHGKAVYGQDGCRKLAEKQPDLAIKNADNYEYFSEAC